MFICEKGFDCIYCPKDYPNESCEHWIEVKPVVRGHWEGDKYPICSECRTYALSDKENLRVVDRCYEIDGSVKFYKDVRYDTVYNKTAFCPHCGAEMSGFPLR